MRDYRKLEVWQLARRMAVESYRVSQSFPTSEAFGLTGQLRRAAVSVAANIAEGAGRDSDADFLRFLRIALGSLNEVETLLSIASELRMGSVEELASYEKLLRDLGVRLRNLAAKISGDRIARESGAPSA
ncbi:MAG: four helix bundle protein [Fimbriimonadaceae bacterium]|nr:four helix bundle protein [Fimbriimonadaceae bacterium]